MSEITASVQMCERGEHATDTKSNGEINNNTTAGLRLVGEGVPPLAGGILRGDWSEITACAKGTESGFSGVRSRVGKGW